MTLLSIPSVASALPVLVPWDCNKKSVVCIYVHSLGILAQVSWKLLDELEDCLLKVLASKLPNTVLHS